MSISSIVYGINDVAEISSSTPQFIADKARIGWNYQATSPTDNIALKIFSEDGLTNTNNLFNITVRGAVGNTTYANIPYLSIKTKPKGDGSDFDPSFHSQQILKIDDNNFVSSDELVYFYYNNLVLQLDPFKKAEYKLVTTNGTLDPLNPILTVELISDNSSTTSFYLQNTEVISKNHQHKFNRVIEYRNKDRLESDVVADIDSINTNTAQIVANQTNDTQKSKCMGIDGTAQQRQLLLESNGSLIIGGGAVKTGIDSLGNTTHLLTDADGTINTTPKINDPVAYTETISVPASGTGSGSPMNTSGYNIIGFAFNSTNTSDAVHLQVSNTSLTWSTIQTLTFPIQGEEIKNPAFKYYRLQQTDTTASGHTISVVVSRRVI